MNTSTGTLYIVATPLGNLGDFSTRGIECLKEVNLILCEDTRKFSRLAQRFGIENKKRSYYEENEHKRKEEVLELLKRGQNIALVSDAGTPTVSDPGYRLVRACQENNISVSTVPGPCAAIAALSISGLASDSFTFYGFLPVKSGKKRTVLEEALLSARTSIFYESPHRIVKTSVLLSELAPQREVFLARELTKMHEETFFMTAENLVTALEHSTIKGEFVLLISPNKK